MVEELSLFLGPGSQVFTGLICRPEGRGVARETWEICQQQIWIFFLLGLSSGAELRVFFTPLITTSYPKPN